MTSPHDIMRLFNYLAKHPLTKDHMPAAIMRVIRWQIMSCFRSQGIRYPFIGDTSLIMRRGLHSATNNIYAGLADFEAMSFLLHFLRAEDLFIDIGAFIGAYTVLASGVKKARTIAIEPIPTTFKLLAESIEINSIKDRVTALNVGVGACDSLLPFTVSGGPMNRVAHPSASQKDVIMLPVRPLDEIAGAAVPALIKIDTEGYLKDIIKGGHKILNNTGLKAIVVELWKQQRIHQILEDYGFKPYAYEPFSRNISPVTDYRKNDLIYIRDLEFVKGRVASSEKFRVFKTAV